ncbi:MAG: UDPGP type 1 family protein [Eubacterium sp.]|nr:UDPGP type 1 family protein [Eubacterium sp.]MBQ7200693.1 UDPGP type 1 family protein [Eubacterium sp.]
MATKEQAVDKLKEYGQEHVLKYFDELSADEQQSLIDEIVETDMEVLKHYDEKGAARGVFSPLKTMELNEIDADKARLKEIGINAIKEGKTAALLLAGGMGTRLGSDNPKGMYNIGITKEVFIFQRIIENLLDVVNEAGATPRLFIMTSDKNNDATIAFLKEKNYFGYPADRVNFFKQDMAPACDYNGKLYMEGKGKLATSPNGNAGWYSSMIKAGLDKIIEDEGIEWVNVFAVDNVLQRICDPAFVGATIDAGVEVGAKVVKKAAPDEKVGVICLEDGRPSIVEYYELSQEMMDAKDDKGDPAYNFGVILNYLFKVSALNRIAKEQTMLHVVEKKIPYIDESGELVKPTEPNGYKFEQLVLDLIHMLDSCLSYEVIRENEFAPIKNATGVDSVESARELCKKNGIEL